MPKFKTGRDLLKKKESGGSRARVSSNYVPFFRLQGGESAYVQILTDMEEVPLVEIHRMVAVKYEDNNGNIKDGYADFTSRAPGLFEDGDGTDWKDIIENQVGHDPDEKFAGIGVVLNPNYKKGSKSTRLSDIESFTVAGRWYESEKNGWVFYPTYEVIFQTSGNFWRKLDSHHEEIGPITEKPWKINREGNDTDTDYIFYSVDAPVFLPEQGEETGTGEEVVDWSEQNVPDISTVLESLGSHERYEKYFGDEKLWAKQKPWAKKGNRNSDEQEEEKSNGSSRGTSRLKKLSDDLDD